MNTAACTNNETRAKRRPGRTLSRTPWQASRLKNTKIQAPPVAAKFAATTENKDGFSCQWPYVTAANSIAHGRLNARTNTAKASSSAPDFARKILLALTGMAAK